ncbi:MAG TPA: bifunctional DNA-formamidopyrimidine glycosylase/DNA-(apurinic or apyrimidinic site) lyase [Trueperaceae bacterium]
MRGRRVLEAALVDAEPGPKYANLPRAAGQTIDGVNRRGKFLILPLSAGDELIIHLGMTGVLSPHRPGAHLRARLLLDPGPDPEVYFRDARRFGRFLVVRAGDYRRLPTLAAMGPEPLSPAFDDQVFAQALSRSELAVKTYLLSQKPVAGVGNIYADEALWRARIHPRTPAKRVRKDKVRPLRRAIQGVLRESLALQGTTLHDYRTVNGEAGAFLGSLAVYGHAGEPCSRCGTPIEKFALAGRGTHLCPHCQRLP